MSRYGFEESIRDGATMPLHFEPRLVELHIDKEAIDAGLRGAHRRPHRPGPGPARQGRRQDGGAGQGRRSASQTICADIARHFQEKVAPNGFGAQVVTFDRESCLLYKAGARRVPAAGGHATSSCRCNSGEDRATRPTSATGTPRRSCSTASATRTTRCKILIVTAKLLTGFDAPILQAMYLDKPLRDHTLLQAICRTNRTYGEQKTHGLIVDYLGVFDDVAQALEFDEEGVRRSSPTSHELEGQAARGHAEVPGLLRRRGPHAARLRGADRRAGVPAQQRRARPFAADYSYLSAICGKRISPDPVLSQYETDYRWLSQVYDSVQAVQRHGRLLWHALGAKTIELIHQNVHVDAVRDDLDTLVLDADLLEAVLGAPGPEQEGQGDRDQGGAPAAQARWATRGSRRWPSGSRTSRSGTSRACSQRRVPQGAARPRPGRRASREARRRPRKTRTAARPR